MKYICPYCNTFKKKEGGNFSNWNSVSRHLRYCLKITGPNKYYFDECHGLIPVNIFQVHSGPYLNYLFPEAKLPIVEIRKAFKNRGFNMPSLSQEWQKEELLIVIKDYYNKYKEIPGVRDLDITFKVFERCFGSFNKAVEAAGYKANYNDGLGQRTVAKDNILYRSKSEAIFVNTFLFGKYMYKYEVPYGNGWFYDFYLPEKDLYIEIDGGLRPIRIQEKIEYNKLHNKNFVVIPTSNLDSIIK